MHREELGEIAGKRVEHWEFLRGLSDKLKAKYGMEHPLTALEVDLIPIIEVFGIEGIKGKRILDLGCGGTDPETDDRIFEPWLCRALKE